MARRRHGVLRAGRDRKDMEWTGTSGDSLGNVGVANLISTIFTSNVSATLLRCRGDVTVMFDGVADGDKKVIGMGLIFASDAQVAAGVTAFPSPIDVLEADWLWHQFCTLQAQSATQSEDLGAQVARYVIDSKAMRKFRPNQQLVFVVDGNNLAGTPVADIAVAMWCLIKFS